MGGETGEEGEKRRQEMSMHGVRCQETLLPSGMMDGWMDGFPSSSSRIKQAK